MSSDTAISVENLGKCYKIQHQGQHWQKWRVKSNALRVGRNEYGIR